MAGKTTKKVMGWAVAKAYRGWVQAGKKGPEAKCDAHYAGPGDDTLCGRMPIRGEQPSKGFIHYNLHWFQIAGPQAATGRVCMRCEGLAKEAKKSAPKAKVAKQTTEQPAVEEIKLAEKLPEPVVELAS